MTKKNGIGIGQIIAVGAIALGFRASCLVEQYIERSDNASQTAYVQEEQTMTENSHGLNDAMQEETQEQQIPVLETLEERVELPAADNMPACLPEPTSQTPRETYGPATDNIPPRPQLPARQHRQEAANRATPCRPENEPAQRYEEPAEETRTETPTVQEEERDLGLYDATYSSIDEFISDDYSAVDRIRAIANAQGDGRWMTDKVLSMGTALATEESQHDLVGGLARLFGRERSRESQLGIYEIRLRHLDGFYRDLVTEGKDYAAPIYEERAEVRSSIERLFRD